MADDLKIAEKNLARDIKIAESHFSNLLLESKKEKGSKDKDRSGSTQGQTDSNYRGCFVNYATKLEKAREQTKILFICKRQTKNEFRKKKIKSHSSFLTVTADDTIF